MSEPSQYNKLIRKIQDIKYNRILKIREKFMISNQVESKLKEIKEEIIIKKQPGQTVDDYKRQKVLENKE